MIEQYWRITPLNEGHDLDYSEIVTGSLESAKGRARKLKNDLQRAMPRASISIRVTNTNNEDEFIVI